MKDLHVGDIIINKDGDRAKVLAVLGEVFCRSLIPNSCSYDKANMVCHWMTFEDAELKGWKVVGATCSKCGK